MKVGLIRDPVVAVAASKCWLWRWTKRVHPSQRVLIAGIEGLHGDQPCNFCEYPADGLIVALDEFLVWSGLGKRDTEVTEFRPAIEAFVMLPPEEQKRRISEAQYD
jgi:hypothetical protein